MYNEDFDIVVCFGTGQDVLCDIFDAYVCKQGYGDEVCRRWQGQTTLK